MTLMAQALLASPSCLSLLATDGGGSRSVDPRAGFTPLPSTGFARSASSFRQGSPLLVSRTSNQRRCQVKALSFTIRCEQSTKESSGLDIWLGRFAMVGFASAITVEIVTGKGILENFGLITPLPTVALAVTGLVGVLTAIFIFQSASKE